MTSKFLRDIVSNKITTEEGLQRLLVIANKTENADLAKWCLLELNGYRRSDELPEYRKFKSGNFIYSGINGTFKITNAPLPLEYLSEDTLKKVKDVYIFDNIKKVEENKSTKANLYRDLTGLAGEVYSNTSDGPLAVQCTSIQQIIPNNFYSSVDANVKTRIINLLCSYESANIDIDKLDIDKSQIDTVKAKNSEIYQAIVLNGALYVMKPKERKIMWNVLVPIIVGVATSVISGLLVYLITNVWLK